MLHTILTFTVLLGAAVSQEIGNTALSNPNTRILDCPLLPCNGKRENSVCARDGEFGSTGVGVINKLVDGTSYNLSLTLIDGTPVGTMGSDLLRGDGAKVSFSTRTLYAGLAPDVNAADLPHACALMMQYQGATFPYPSSMNESTDRTTTTCPQSFQFAGGLSRIAGYIRAFDQSSCNANSGSAPTCCEALAQYVEYRLHEIDPDSLRISSGSYLNTLIAVAGGTISGPQVQSDFAGIDFTDPDSCRPTSPGSNLLHNVTAALQVLRGSAVDSDGMYGGRTGFTPVISVVYDKRQSADADTPANEPMIEAYCIHLADTHGQELPFSTLRYNNAASPQNNPISRFAVMLVYLTTITWLVS